MSSKRRIMGVRERTLVEVTTNNPCQGLGSLLCPARFNWGLSLSHFWWLFDQENILEVWICWPANRVASLVERASRVASPPASRGESLLCLRLSRQDTLRLRVEGRRRFDDPQDKNQWSQGVWSISATRFESIVLWLINSFRRFNLCQKVIERENATESLKTDPS